MVHLFLTNSVGERKTCVTMLRGQLDIHKQKDEFSPLHHTQVDLNIKGKLIKLLEKNT